jgi:hypothetical protein
VVPTWVAIVTGFSGAVVGLFITPIVELGKTRMTSQQAREAALAEDRRETTKSNREIILKAIELVDSERPETKQRGWTMMASLSKSENLSIDDATLVGDLLRLRAAGQLREARALEESTGEEAAFFVTAGSRPMVPSAGEG